MALSIPSIQDTYNKIKVSIYSYTKGLLQVEQDPPIRAIVEEQAKTQNAIYNIAQDAINQTFSQTVTDEAYLSQIALDRTRNEIQRNDPTFAQGTVLLQANSIPVSGIPANTQFITSDGQVYSSLVYKDVSDQQFVITSLQRTSGYVTGTLVNHQLGNGMLLTIAGSSPNTFDGIQTIEVLSNDTFGYANAGIDQSATGTIIGSFLGARVQVQSINAEADANKTFTDAIDLAVTIDEIDSSFITFSGITGGTDLESFDSFKARVIENLTTPQNKGNRFQHQSWTKQNTAANFVYFFPSEDDFYLYLTGVISKKSSTFDFTNFSVDELAAIKQLFIDNNQLLLGVTALNLTITNPSFVNINLTITSLVPNTLEMQTAVNNVVKEYLSLIPIKFYMSGALSEINSDKLKTIVSIARDSNGVTPTFASLSVSGSGSLTTDISKPILGTITYA